jgi:hypothetical protein
LGTKEPFSWFIAGSFSHIFSEEFRKALKPIYYFEIKRVAFFFFFTLFYYINFFSFFLLQNCGGNLKSRGVIYINLILMMKAPQLSRIFFHASFFMIVIILKRECLYWRSVHSIKEYKKLPFFHLLNYASYWGQSPRILNPQGSQNITSIMATVHLNLSLNLSNYTLNCGLKFWWWVFEMTNHRYHSEGLKQGWAKLALYIKLAPTLQLLLFEILTWGFLHLVVTDQT